MKPGFYEPTETEIKDYSPECIDLVPVISFELELENNVNKTIFQCDSDDLETIIKLFQAARKDLDSANQYLMKKGKNF